MQGVIKYALLSLLALSFVVLAHFKLGGYPKPLPRSENIRREFFEAILIWGLMFVSVTYVMLSRYVFFRYYPFIAVASRLLPLPHLFLMFEVPLLIEMVLNKRGWSDLGMSLPVSRAPAIASIGFGILSGFFGFLLEPSYPHPWDYLALGLLTPAFTEEWVYRGGVQQKLERAIGQHRSWIIGGLLYGLIHIPTDFFGTLWITSGGSLYIALALFVNQCAYGWLWGILFIKTRSLIPTIICHYLANYLPFIIARL